MGAEAARPPHLRLSIVLGALFLFTALSFATGSWMNRRDGAFVGYEESIRSTSVEQVQEKEYLVLRTGYGVIKVLLESEAAPIAVNYIKKLVREGLFQGCGIYRVEPPGDTVDDGNEEIRKGYALVQAGLYKCGQQQDVRLPVESFLRNERGAVSLITGTSEFFFNLEAHPEWDGSFSVFGTVQDVISFDVLEKLVSLPVVQERHPSGTVLRILKDAVIFEVSLTP